ncbi:hypothetical protein CLOM_g20329 [Closterium sp. NIES-68]|nr:hypothetical protein CLOM_g20329 [Closterium sp. NIES-68]GJP75080.1 hypothetical protein CLOP_g5575 [Closterium sp. NIES-67]GJP80757.1 hypothetical protein CLOP_g10959 [Closterium sp. NIES-67]
MLPTRFRDGRQRSSPSLCDVASSPRRRHAIFLSLLLVASSLTIVSAYSCSSVPGLALLEPKYLNRVSRYVSMGHDESCGCWHVFVDVDWRDLDGVKGVRSEGACKSSWAITAVNAVEATFAIVTSAIGSNDTIFNISVQQVVDCEPSSSSCKGGWPTSALDYMVDASQDQGGLVPEQAYPYKGKQAKCSGDKIAASSTPVGLARYEQVDYYGWIGLLLAVQVQPVIAFVRGSYPSFQKYRAGVYSDPKCAAAGIVDHSVLVVGYSFTGPDGEGHWIVRNSWGTKWGEKGHMRMSFAGGTGICGIHAVPAIYPIIQVPSPCDSPQKPCGGGECVPDGSGGYSCLCPTPFVSLTNDDGTQTCAPLDACGSQASNPCLTGTCINDNVGGYFCLCPPGYDKGSRPLGWDTCTPSDSPPSTLSFPVDVDCPLVYQLFGLTEEAFLAQNPSLASPCVTIPASTEVNVAPTPSCVSCNLYYSWSSDDTCAAVAALFALDETELTRLNPGLDCSGADSCAAPSAGQQICVHEGEGMDYPMCVWWADVRPGDTCAALMGRYNLNALTFFWLNPGLKCDALFPNGMEITGVQVCIFAYVYGGNTSSPFRSYSQIQQHTALSLPSTPLSLGKLATHQTAAQRTSTHQVSPLRASHTLPTPLQPLQQSPWKLAWATAHPTSKPHFTPPLWRQPAWQQRQQSLVKAGVLRAAPAAVSKRRCLKFYSVTRGDFCARIISLKFQGSARKMADLNSGYVCVNDRLYVGLSLCTQR